MKFKEAYKKLQKMAKGKYNAMQFGVTTYKQSDLRTSCSLYIEDYIWTKGYRTWKEAFAQMEEAVNPHPKENEEISNISDHEDLTQEKRRAEGG